jgi:hypothetical protein
MARNIDRTPLVGNNTGKRGTHAVKDGGRVIRTEQPPIVNDLNDSPKPRRNPPRANLRQSVDSGPRITQR